MCVYVSSRLLLRTLLCHGDSVVRMRLFSESYSTYNPETANMASSFVLRLGFIAKSRPPSLQSTRQQLSPKRMDRSDKHIALCDIRTAFKPPSSRPLFVLDSQRAGCTTQQGHHHNGDRAARRPHIFCVHSFGALEKTVPASLHNQPM